MLENISKIKKLTKSQIEKAKILLSWRHIFLRLEDDLVSEMEEIPGDPNDDPLFKAINKKLINYNYYKDQVFTRIKESIII